MDADRLTIVMEVQNGAPKLTVEGQSVLASNVERNKAGHLKRATFEVAKPSYVKPALAETEREAVGSGPLMISITSSATSSMTSSSCSCES